MSILEFVTQVVIGTFAGVLVTIAYFAFRCWLDDWQRERADKQAVTRRWADIEKEGPEPTLDEQTFELSILLPLPTLEKWVGACGIKSMQVSHWMDLPEPVVIETKSIGTVRIVGKPEIKRYVHFTDAKEAMLFQLAFGGAA